MATPSTSTTDAPLWERRLSRSLLAIIAPCIILSRTLHLSIILYHTTQLDFCIAVFATLLELPSFILLAGASLALAYTFFLSVAQRNKLSAPRVVAGFLGALLILFADMSRTIHIVLALFHSADGGVWSLICTLASNTPSILTLVSIWYFWDWIREIFDEFFKTDEDISAYVSTLTRRTGWKTSTKPGTFKTVCRACGSERDPRDIAIVTAGIL